MGIHNQSIYMKDILEESYRLYYSKLAIIDYNNNNKYQYSDLERRASRIAKFLEENGVKSRDRIAYLLTNRVECIDLFMASSKLGTILVPLNWRLTRYELGYVLKNIKPRVLVYESTFRESAIEASKDLSDTIKIVLDEEPKNNEHGYEEALKSSSFQIKREVLFEEPRMILYTGGTTGFPKGAIISYRQILFNIMSEIITWRLKENHKTIVLLPLFHTGGWNLLTLPLLAIGGMLYMTRRFDPKSFLEIIESEKHPFVIMGVPTIYYMISKEERFEDTSFENVEWMISGGAAIDKKIMERFWDKGVKLAQGYGITEGGPNNLTMPIHDLSLDEIKKKWRSVGKPFAFNKIMIVDEEGKELGPNEYGEIVICGPIVFSGYWENLEETANILRDGCIYTGDIGFYDEEGYFYIVDRKKDIIKSGGEQIYPREIEDLVLQHPLIEDCAVIPVSDEKWGEVPKLVVKIKTGSIITKENILRFLENKVAKYKMPKYIAIATEIPRSPAGKILKRILIQKYGSPIDEI